MKMLLILLSVGCISCSLFDGMKTNSFTYNDEKTLSLLIPKGYRKKNISIDSAGNKTQVFTYSNGGELYFYFGDTTNNHFSIDTSLNIPKYYPTPVLFYKGQENSNLFWRESRYKNFRFGYIKISAEREALFDSAVNHAAWQALKQ